MTVYQLSLERIFTPSASNSGVLGYWGWVEIFEEEGEGCEVLGTFSVCFQVLNWPLVWGEGRLLALTLPISA